MVLIDSLLWGIGTGLITTLLASLRPLAWRYAVVVGLGSAIVFAALRLAMVDPTVDRGILVLLAAIGGSVATLGLERGDRARAAMSAAILARRSPPLA